MDYPSHDQYAKIYARYLAPGRTEQMLELCGDLTGKYMLDLCGGGGRASRAALSRGAAGVTLVDESLPMSMDASAPGLAVFHADLKSTLTGPVAQGVFDVAFCQQAINYWFEEDLIAGVHRQLKLGGIFVFNTFNEPPTTYPNAKTYEYNGLRYVELSWRSSERMVEHVQICEGEPVHTTRFQWITPQEYQEVLGRYFDVEEIRENKTSIYRCTAR